MCFLYYHKYYFMTSQKEVLHETFNHYHHTKTQHDRLQTKTIPSGAKTKPRNSPTAWRQRLSISAAAPYPALKTAAEPLPIWNYMDYPKSSGNRSNLFLKNILPDNRDKQPKPPPQAMHLPQFLCPLGISKSL